MKCYRGIQGGENNKWLNFSGDQALQEICTRWVLRLVIVCFNYGTVFNCVLDLDRLLQTVITALMYISGATFIFL